MIIDQIEIYHVTMPLIKLKENDIISVKLPNSSQPHLSVCTPVLQIKINLHYTYPLLYHRSSRGATALFMDNIDHCLELLIDKGHQIIINNDLSENDEYS